MVAAQWGGFKLRTEHWLIQAKSRTYIIQAHMLSFFARRVVGPWNRVPVDIDFSSLAGFKASVKRTEFKASVKRTDLSNCLLYCVN